MSGAPAPRGASVGVSRRKAWLLPLIRRYVKHRLRGAFEAVYVAGLAPVRAALEAGPLIIAANHVAWWDPFVIAAIDARLHGEGHALMDAESLRRLWFFGAVGAVPLRRDSARHAREDLASAVTLLDGPRKPLWIFPQGRQRPSHLRPLGLASGVAWLAEHSGAPTVSLSISYLYREAPEPAVFAAFGRPMVSSTRRELLADLERSLVDGLDRNDLAATAPAGARESDYEPLWAPPRRDAIPLGGRLLTRAGRGQDV